MQDAMELRFMAANADVQAGDMLTTSGVDGSIRRVCRWLG
jgi:cell shape-determining protein MreC